VIASTLESVSPDETHEAAAAVDNFVPSRGANIKGAKNIHEENSCGARETAFRRNRKLKARCRALAKFFDVQFAPTITTSRT
jgi:hypothetical protein